MTAASLLNTTSRGGLFHELLATCTVLISEEASQIPEPAFVATASRFPQAWHIGSSRAARPPDFVFYSAALVSRPEAREHRLVTNRLRLPNPAIALVFVGIEGDSYPSPSGSYWNEDEAGWCRDIARELLALEARPSSIAIITLFKEQLRLLSHYAALRSRTPYREFSPGTGDGHRHRPYFTD
ncbi:unnamed protein product [Heligmosomoides polygyrus]|uniref:AAA_12 domain-containing protein n=1 Tax=Heligmosomoides polygyrus TaxID=6339 RepID=A0A183G6I5_HELPZ|nr:unnamed protein product [Heligmosomoides polygyrus]